KALQSSQEKGSAGIQVELLAFDPQQSADLGRRRSNRCGLQTGIGTLRIVPSLQNAIGEIETNRIVDHGPATHTASLQHLEAKVAAQLQRSIRIERGEHGDFVLLECGR